MEWIDLKDEMPELGERVMICFIGETTGERIIKIDCMIKYHSNPSEWKSTSGKVTHWMPLPEPPKPKSSLFDQLAAITKP